MNMRSRLVLILLGTSVTVAVALWIFIPNAALEPAPHDVTDVSEEPFLSGVAEDLAQAPTSVCTKVCTNGSSCYWDPRLYHPEWFLSLPKTKDAP